MAIFDHPVTPAEIGPTLQKLIRELVPNGHPFYVNVVPQDDASQNDCFIHVPARAQQDGGVAILGWSLWEFPGLFVEAEAHTVWLQPTGDYLDITPKRAQTARIFFLPDPTLRYEGRQINNVRKPLIQDSFVQEYLDTFTDEFNLLNRGERAFQHGEISLTDDEAMEYHAIQTRRAKAYVNLLPRLPQFGPYLPCPCGSGKKMKWCHKVWV